MMVRLASARAFDGVQRTPAYEPTVFEALRNQPPNWLVERIRKLQQGIAIKSVGVAVRWVAAFLVAPRDTVRQFFNFGHLQLSLGGACRLFTAGPKELAATRRNPPVISLPDPGSRNAP